MHIMREMHKTLRPVSALLSVLISVQLALCFSFPAWSATFSAENIPQFKKVTDTIYRGGRPNEQGLKTLVNMKFKTIVNIENNAFAIQKEVRKAQALGLESIVKSMDWATPPTDKLVNEVLEALDDAKNHPVFLHCKHGEDRTGMIIGLYRVFYQKWTPKQAYQEMLDNDFHPEYKALDDYFREKTGYKE